MPRQLPPKKVGKGNTRKPKKISFSKGQLVHVTGGRHRGTKGQVVKPGNKTTTVMISGGTVQPMEKMMLQYTGDGYERTPISFQGKTQRSQILGIDTKNLKAHRSAKPKTARRLRRVDPVTDKLNEIFRLRWTINAIDARVTLENLEWRRERRRSTGQNLSEEEAKEEAKKEARLREMVKRAETPGRKNRYSPEYDRSFLKERIEQLRQELKDVKLEGMAGRTIPRNRRDKRRKTRQTGKLETRRLLDESLAEPKTPAKKRTRTTDGVEERLIRRHSRKGRKGTRLEDLITKN